MQNLADDGHWGILDCGIFRLSKWLSLFPLLVADGRPVLSTLQLLLSFIFLCGTHFWVILFVDDFYLSKTNFTIYVTTISMMLTSTSSLLVLSLSCRKLSRSIETLEKVDFLLAHRFQNPMAWKVTSAIYFFYGTLLSMYDHLVILHSAKIYLLWFIIFQMILIVIQFSTLLSAAKLRYQYMIHTLDGARAELWTYCHDLLSQFNKDVSDCYAPQLVLVTLVAFLYAVSNSYVVIKWFGASDSLYQVSDLILWMILFTSLAWLICHFCRETILKAKEFDNILYQLVIYDKSKALLRNKKIILHFKSKKVEDFSAMGFFRFDYPLLCSMVSSATTYVVIMVQFSQ